MFVLLLLLWLALVGSVTIESIVAGVISAAALTAFCSRFIDHGLSDTMPPRTWPSYLAYFPYLLGQIMLSCFSVLRMIWSHSELKPVIVRFSVPLTDEADRVLLANSITLTPGTITVNTQEGRFTVHALDASLAEDIECCGFVKRLARLEEKR